MPLLLLTAFEPFDGESINPSWETAALLDGSVIDGWQVAARCLPCVFDDSLSALESAVAELRPDAVIALGQAGGRSAITPERIAVNLNDARIPDNAGRQPCDTAVIEDAPAAYFSTLPVKAITAALNEAGIPAALSYTAGTFVCNHVFFGLQHLAARYGIAQSGFVHIPYLPEQACRHAGAPSMARETLLRGLRLMVSALAAHRQDIQSGGGITH